MKKIIRKQNGDVKTYQLNDLSNAKLNFFDDIQSKSGKGIKRDINDMVDLIAKCDNNLLYFFMDELKHVKTKEDMLVLALDFYENYKFFSEKNSNMYSKEVYKNFYNMMKNRLETEPKVVLNELAIKIIRRYYFDMINNLSSKKLSVVRELFDLNMKSGMKDVFDVMNEHFYETSFESGVYDLSSKVCSNVIESIYNSNSIHLCFQDCENACPNKCPKINDEHKKNIANYDFIVSGYQVIKDDKILDKFVVSNCLRYEYVKKK